jgi:hypothetical protein
LAPEAERVEAVIQLDPDLPSGDYRLVVYLSNGREDAAGAARLVLPAD